MTQKMAKSNEALSTVNIRTVKEQILDENKLITYLSVSKDLCIHVNDAKLLLRQVIEEIREKGVNTNLRVNYVISGLSSDKIGRTLVCSESSLETEKSSFQKLIFQHIYSVCQGSGNVDKVAFVSLNKFEDLSLCPGLIKAHMCKKRSSDEIGTLKSNSQPTAKEITKPVTIKKDNVKISLNDHKETNNVAKTQQAKPAPTISPKKDTADSSIGKHNNKNGNKLAKNGRGIAGFFAKSNTKLPKSDESKNKEIVKDASVEIKSQPDVKQEIMDVDEEIVTKTDTKKDKNEIKKEPESSNKNKKNSSLNHIKKNAKVDKKRKRVLHVSDSESEGENDPFVDEKEPLVESEDEIPPTPSTNTVKITSGILNPKKKRKIVDKTYTDDEGYILTRKEEVFESCSEDEVEIPNKPVIEVKPEKENIKQINNLQSEVLPKGKGNVAKKKSPPQKGKQGNIMNFFKKV